MNRFSSSASSIVSGGDAVSRSSMRSSRSPGRIASRYSSVRMPRYAPRQPSTLISATREASSSAPLRTFQTTHPSSYAGDHRHKCKPSPGLRKVPAPPLEHGVEALLAVPGFAGARQFVTLAGEHEEFGVGAALTERDEHPLRLFERAAPVLFGVHDRERDIDLPRVGQRAH